MGKKIGISLSQLEYYFIPSLPVWLSMFFNIIICLPFVCVSWQSVSHLFVSFSVIDRNFYTFWVPILHLLLYNNFILLRSITCVSTMYMVSFKYNQGHQSFTLSFFGFCLLFNKAFSTLRSWTDTTVFFWCFSGLKTFYYLFILSEINFSIYYNVGI